MSVSEELVEKGAKALRDDTAYASSYARKVLEAVLPDIEAQIKAAQDEVEWPETMYGDGILTGLRHALDIIRGKRL